MSAPDSPPTEPGPLYASRTKIQPRDVKGFYRTLKNVLLWSLLLVYHFAPWIPYDRPGTRPDQAILFDIPGERIYFFAAEIWPQDIYILTGVMILAAVGLFISAALWGRAWCGFLCFQTLWTDLFMKIEAWAEGDRNARIRLDAAPWSLSKLAKRSLKHAGWLAVSGFFALSFMWYFDDAAQMTKDIFTANISGWALATFLTLMAMTYIMAGFAREQVCLYMCPYGRFQGVMLDEHSKVITYEEWRGEDRGKPGKNKDFSNRGHCVDCTLCVQVCPTGVDIRDGQQMGCIGCGLCIDACDEVMERFGLPSKLISYDSVHNIAKRAETKQVVVAKAKFWRPRTVAYAAILLATVGITAFGMATREFTKVTVLKDRAPFYVQLSDGHVQNAYTVRVLNKEQEDKRFKFFIEGDVNPAFKIVGQDDAYLTVPAGTVKTVRVIVKGQAHNSQPLEMMIQDLKDASIFSEETVFHGPKS